MRKTTAISSRNKKLKRRESINSKIPQKKDRDKVPICPRCFTRVKGERIRCTTCGFILATDNNFLYEEDLEKGN